VKLIPAVPINSKLRIECGLRTFDKQSDLNTFQTFIRPNSCPRDFVGNYLTLNFSRSNSKFYN
jgi:hypothetical protein